MPRNEIIFSESICYPISNVVGKLVSGQRNSLLGRLGILDTRIPNQLEFLILPKPVSLPNIISYDYIDLFYHKKKSLFKYGDQNLSYTCHYSKLDVINKGYFM